MKSPLCLCFVMILLTVSGCAGTTLIKNVALPPVTTIEGTVTQLEEHGFSLTDASGSIFVRAQLPNHEKLDLALHENVKVYGNLRGGPERVFDGYVIRKPTGEQIIVTEPSPHFGFIIQTRLR